MDISGIIGAELVAAPASERTFRPYGQIIEVGSRPVLVNNGTALRHDLGDVLTNKRAASALLLSVFEAEPQEVPLRLEMLECHPRSAQAIVPMQAERYLVAVCLPGPGGEPAASTLKAFIFGPEQGVNYKPGVWHAPIIALGKRSLFFVQSWQDGSEADCLETAFGPVLLTEGDV